MQQKRVVFHSFFMAKHLFIKTVAKLYFVVAKVFLFALVPIILCRDKSVFIRTGANKCVSAVIYNSFLSLVF